MVIQKTYTYDSHNNRKTVTQGKKQTAYRYDRNDRLQRTDTLNTKTKKDAVALYKYDAAGNQLATVHRNETEEDTPVFDLNVTLGHNRLNDNVVNTYDAEDRLVRTLTGNQKATYTYNAEGYRASKTVNGKTTTYIWDGDQIILELDDKGEVSRRYLRGNSLICADTGKGTERQYYVTNPHGDTVQLVNKEGEILRQYDYDAFGNEIKEDKKDDNPFRYAGEYYDSETGNIYLRARYYAPGLGRFLTRDTYTGEEDDPLSLHLYTYCDNDGVNQIDPSGHWGQKDGFGYKGDRYVHKNDEVKDKYKRIFHGKSKKNLDDLIKEAKIKLFSAGHKKEGFLLVGCILHSIQDYSAHSYYGDLEIFKMTKDKDSLSQQVKIYHCDWLVRGITIDKRGKKKIDKEKARQTRRKIHRKYKDNPYAVLTYNKFKRIWEWGTVDSAKKNERYVKAIND